MVSSNNSVCCGKQNDKKYDMANVFLIITYHTTFNKYTCILQLNKYCSSPKNENLVNYSHLNCSTYIIFFKSPTQYCLYNDLTVVWCVMPILITNYFTISVILFKQYNKKYIFFLLLLTKEQIAFNRTNTIKRYQLNKLWLSRSI